ncbi:interleukin-17A [Cuculus canorus]|uniref:interleukin-17A n=1 Tax=Cuculus canorus TaxID=55661 RepID=UPI0023AA3607|nr:interleukin-17A [Cuculus canorus]
MPAQITPLGCYEAARDPGEEDEETNCFFAEGLAGSAQPHSKKGAAKAAGIVHFNREIPGELCLHSPVPFAPTFRTALLMLLAVLSARNSAYGKVIRPELRLENIFKQSYAGCPTPKDTKFPQTVRVNISISNMNQDTRTTLDASSRSLAPWDYRIDEDHHRFPRVIADAKCRHARCLNSNGQLDHSLNSVPIKQEILVLQRERKGCHQSYRLEKKIITVGCTCVTPLIQHQA